MITRTVSPREGTAVAVLAGISLSHLLNDTVQALIPAIYPMLKAAFSLSFAQVGLMTLAQQLTASVLQPLVGLYTDRRPMPYSLVIGMKRRFRAARPARRLRRQSHWAVMLGTALAASTTTGVQPAAAAEAGPASQGASQTAAPASDTRRLEFQIPVGPLDGAVAEFERVTGLKVTLVDPRIGTVQSSGAVGTLTPAAAMDAMLAGTAVRATFGPDGVRLDIRGVSEFVAVEGQPLKVKSPKYSERLRDTGQTVVVIPQHVYQEQNATSLREVLRNTPGITMRGDILPGCPT